MAEWMELTSKFWKVDEVLKVSSQKIAFLYIATRSIQDDFLMEKVFYSIING